MTSLIAVPLQLLATTSELFFVLQNKLRIQREDFNVPSLKCDSIMEDALGRVLSQMKLHDLFKERKALSLDELRTFFKVLVHEDLYFEADSFEKVGKTFILEKRHLGDCVSISNPFSAPSPVLSIAKLFVVACMTVKVQLTRTDSATDMLFVLNGKMLLLQELFSNPLVKQELCRRRDAVNIFYRSLWVAELHRVRTTVLNSFRGVCAPVSVLVNEGMQLKSGRAVAHKSGPNARNLGLCRIFTDDKAGFKEHIFCVAEGQNARKDEAVQVSGENLYVVELSAFCNYKSL